MKATFVIFGIVASCLFAITRPGAGAVPQGESKQEPAKQDNAGKPDIAEEVMEVVSPLPNGMDLWMKSNKPGKPHKSLGQFIGKWDVEMTVLGMGPATKSQGTAEYRWLVDGRWILRESEGSLMGMPVKSFSIIGFDNYKKKYVSVAVDSMTTSMLTAMGNKDMTGRNLIMYGKMDEPMSGELEKTVKYILRIVDDNKHVVEIHDLGIGEKNTKVIEMIFTRKK